MDVKNGEPVLMKNVVDYGTGNMPSEYKLVVTHSDIKFDDKPTLIKPVITCDNLNPISDFTFLYFRER
jgi:hypothetical protein